MEFNNREPIYHQIINLIKKDIITGAFKSGDKLPSVREMAEKYKVNPNTVQRVYQLLEMEQITFTQRGMGTYITEDGEKVFKLKMEMADMQIENFVSEMKGLGFSDQEIIEAVRMFLKGE